MSSSASQTHILCHCSLHKFRSVVRPPGALGHLQERILRSGGQYEGLPLAAALALTAAADFGEVMLEAGIIFTGAGSCA